MKVSKATSEYLDDFFLVVIILWNSFFLYYRIPEISCFQFSGYKSVNPPLAEMFAHHSSGTIFILTLFGAF